MTITDAAWVKDDQEEILIHKFMGIGTGPPDVTALSQAHDWLYTVHEAWQHLSRWVDKTAGQCGMLGDEDGQVLYVSFPNDVAWEVTRRALDVKERARELISFADTILENVDHLALSTDGENKRRALANSGDTPIPA
jgi:hypothetical protein